MEQSNINRRDALQGALKSLVGLAAVSTAGGLLLPGTAHALGVPSYRRIELDVVSDGQRIGEFVGSFSGSAGGTFVAETRVVIESNVYSVDASNREEWSNGVLTRLTGVGDDNGNAFSFEITGNGNGLSGQNNRGKSVGSRQDALPTTYWNRDYRSTRRVINSLAGDDFAVRTTELGQASVTNRLGTYTYDQVRVQGAGLGLYNVVLNYDHSGDWSGLSFSLFGFDVDYLRRA